MAKWWLSLGVTVTLLALVWAVSVTLAQGPEGDPTGGSGDAATGIVVMAPTGGGGDETDSFSYQGRLVIGGTPVTGYYDFLVYLYTAEVGGTYLGSCSDTGTGLNNYYVQDGIFTFYLVCGGWNTDVFTGGSRWLEVHVSPHSVGPYTTLARQPISPAPYAFSLYPGAIISSTVYGGSFGDALLNIHNNNTVSTWSALHVETASGNAVYGDSVGGPGIYGYTEDGYGVYGWDGGSTQARGYGGYFYSANGVGVYGYSGAAPTTYNSHAPGVYGRSWEGAGVYGISNGANGHGGYFENVGTGIGLFARGHGSWKYDATLRVDNDYTSCGMAGYITNNSDCATTHFQNNGSGQVLWLVNGGTDAAGTGGGDFITALNNDASDTQFRVTTSGDVYSDGNFHSGGADFAEMLPATEGLEPGDVLVVGSDGQLAHSSEAYQSSVVGVYSTQPGFVGGQPVEGELAGHVPLAVMGVVPVKASAENGPIQPGDLLTTSSTPGHAMRAERFVGGAIIGKALEGLDEGFGVIQMLVMLQ
jgi:hypothetical protein